MRREFEYVRHGVVHLFTAFEVSQGRVIAQVHERKTRWEFLELLEECARQYRGEVHCVLDNASYHKTAEIQKWLSEHPRFHFHFTPTHASWLNQAECWFSILSRKALRRGVFDSKEALSQAILDFVSYWNARAHPFNWVYGEELLLEKSSFSSIAAPVQDFC